MSGMDFCLQADKWSHAQSKTKRMLPLVSFCFWD